MQNEDIKDTQKQGDCENSECGNSQCENENVNVEEVIVEESKKEEATEETSGSSSELDALKDKYLRTVAEYDNFRRRTVKEKENIYTEACADVLKQMLPVLDNLERALVTDGSLEDLKKGIEMTMRQFQGALEKLNVQEISCDGEFDPNLHNAVMHIEDEAYGKNAIVEVFQKGYTRSEKVLRYSMVKVAN